MLHTPPRKYRNSCSKVSLKPARACNFNWKKNCHTIFCLWILWRFSEQIFWREPSRNCIWIREVVFSFCDFFSISYERSTEENTKKIECLYHKYVSKIDISFIQSFKSSDKIWIYLKFIAILKQLPFYSKFQKYFKRFFKFDYNYCMIDKLISIYWSWFLPSKISTFKVLLCTLYVDNFRCRFGKIRAK